MIEISDPILSLRHNRIKHSSDLIDNTDNWKSMGIPSLYFENL